MLWTDLSTGFAFFLFLLCSAAVLIVIWMLKLATYCRDAVAFVQNQNKRALSLRRIAELEATQTELLDAYNSLLASHKKLRSRIGMRNLREKRGNGVDLDKPAPAGEADRASYKSRLREQAKQRGLLR